VLGLGCDFNQAGGLFCLQCRTQQPCRLRVRRKIVKCGRSHENSCARPWGCVCWECAAALQMSNAGNQAKGGAPLNTSFLKVWGVMKKMRLWDNAHSSARRSAATLPVSSSMCSCRVSHRLV